MRTMIFGGAVLALLAGDAFAQDADKKSATPPKTATQSKSTAAPAKPATPASKPNTGKPRTILLVITKPAYLW
jgi:hypothetical protein